MKIFGNGAAVAVISVLAIWGESASAQMVRIGGDGSGLAVMQRLEEPFKKQNPATSLVFVKGLSSGGARKALPAGAIDIAITSRPGKLAESIDGMETRAYGKAPFVFATSWNNPTARLTSQDLIDIYSGKKFVWPHGERLRIVLRPQTDSDSKIVSEISPALADALKTAHAREGIKVALTDSESADAIQATPGGFGTSTLALLLAEKRMLKALAVDNHTPSAKSLADNSYPWFKTYFASVKADGLPVVRQFFEFLFSPRAREALVSLGHLVAQ